MAMAGCRGRSSSAGRAPAATCHRSARSRLPARTRPRTAPRTRERTRSASNKERAGGALELEQAVRDRVDGHGLASPKVLALRTEFANVPVDVHSGPELEHEPVERFETDMCRVGGVPESRRRRVRQQDVDAAAAQTCSPFELSRTPPHLALRVLVRALVVADRPAQAGDPDPGGLIDAPVDVDATWRSSAVELRRQTFERRIAELELGVVVARHV